MRTIFTQIICFFTVGALVAATSIQFNFSTGVIGAISLIAYSKWVKQTWTAAASLEIHEFSHCEQALWVQLAAYTLLLGHSVTSLLHTEVDMRLGQGSSLAIDSWLMVLAALTTEYIFKNDKKAIDERDLEYSAKAVVWGYRALAFQVVLFAIFLAITPPSYRNLFSHFLIGNVLIAFCLASYCVYISVRLFAYYHDRRDIQELRDDA